MEILNLEITENEEKGLLTGALPLISLNCPTENSLFANSRKIWKNTTVKHLMVMVRSQINGENTQNWMILRV